MTLATFVLPVGRTAKLGRRKPRFTHPHLLIKDYIRPGAAVPPASYTNTTKLAMVGMGGNDQVGDCVENMMANVISAWTAAATGKERTFTPDEVIGWYSSITGYAPGNPATDNGTVMQDGFAFWQSRGLSGDTLPGYVGLNPTNTQHHKIGVWEFGASCLGLALPLAWQGQSSSSGTWDVGPNQRGEWAPYSWGGHAVPLLAYDETGGWVATWGYLQRVTWQAILAYCDEAYACASWDWCLTSGTPSGVLRNALIADFASIGGGNLTPPSPPPGPGPTQGTVVLDLAKQTYSFPPGWNPAGGQIPTVKGSGSE